MNRHLYWIVLLLGSCADGADQAPATAQSAPEEEYWADDGILAEAEAPPAPPEPSAVEGKPARSSSKAEAGGYADASAATPPSMEPMDKEQAREQAEEPATRAWFPESFLFEPLVVTDASGAASLEVPVPDQLTDWRVLALAHSRDGSQAGTETRFASTLPVYLDVVEPPPLRVGDRLRLPLQVVNNQDADFRGGLSAMVNGEAAWGSISGTMGVAGGASRLQYVDVHAVRPGRATIKAVLVGTDQVERPLTVVPTGRRLDRSQGGTLAAAREFQLLAPHGAQQGSSSLSLVVYPGPLSILAEEMARSLGGHALAETAYGYALAGYGRDIALRLGQEVDEDALRRSRLVAYQRLVRFTRSPGLPDAVVALSAARTQPDDQLAVALTQRLVDQVENGQSPDGSFAAAWQGGEARLERALALSALATRSCEGHTRRVRQRSAGFVARNAGYVKDPYTAALILAADLADGPARERLVELVTEAVQRQPDGTSVVGPGARSLRVDGRVPGQVEATAWAILALADSEPHQELVSDLAAALLGAYRPGRGFGDGLAGLAALEALSMVFDQPLPDTVKVTLQVDGEPTIERDLALAGNYAPLVAQTAAPEAAGLHSYRLEATPAVPGLAFTVKQTSYLPWSGDPGSEGFSLRVDASGPAAVGSELPCRLQAAVPGGESFEVELELPAGVEVDEASLVTLRDQGAITGFQSSEGHLELSGPALPSGSVFDATIILVPTLAGSYQWGGAVLALADSPGQRVQSPVGALDVALR